MNRTFDYYMNTTFVDNLTSICSLLPKITKSTIEHIISNALPISAFVAISKKGVIPSNWGDDLNYFLLKQITRKKIILRNWSIPCRLGMADDYLCIGSTLSMLTTKRSLVWGTGVISDDAKISAKPKKVLAVRGPLTREWLLKQGVICPEIYGDPALLCPKVYVPEVEKKYDFGIIPHYAEQQSPDYMQFIERNPNIHIIDIKRYGKWTNFIDEINSCRHILSSSLHGIIISDAYNIPNVWLKPSRSIMGGEFKYHDYFESTSYHNRKACSLSWPEISKQLDKWILPKIDLTPLIEAAPFTIYK